MGDVVKWLTCSYRRSLIICQYGRRQIASSSHSFLVIRGWICLEYETTLIDLLLSSNFRMKIWTNEPQINIYIYINRIYNKYSSKLLPKISYIKHCVYLTTKYCNFAIPPMHSFHNPLHCKIISYFQICLSFGGFFF